MPAKLEAAPPQCHDLRESSTLIVLRRGLLDSHAVLYGQGREGKLMQNH